MIIVAVRAFVMKQVNVARLAGPVLRSERRLLGCMPGLLRLAAVVPAGLGSLHGVLADAAHELSTS